jgi:hypothetical protein
MSGIAKPVFAKIFALILFKLKNAQVAIFALINVPKTP